MAKHLKMGGAHDRPETGKGGMLVGHEYLRVAEMELDFAGARQVADRSALEALANRLLLAWFEIRARKHCQAMRRREGEIPISVKHAGTTKTEPSVDNEGAGIF